MGKRKILFIDRDGTLIDEPSDKQVDDVLKLKLKSGVIPALLQLQSVGYELVMITNQDGLGTESFPEENFLKPHLMLLDILQSQGIQFAAIHICPHKPEDNCQCRKPGLALVLDYLNDNDIDLNNCYVIGDRKTDIELANNMQIKGFLYDDCMLPWSEILKQLCFPVRYANVERETHETYVKVAVDLDNPNNIVIDTGIGFFDHMLSQLAKHGNFSLQLTTRGDLHVDEHHTIEDTAIVLGQALRKALGDKVGTQRYGFLLPMDEALSHVALDLSGRVFFTFDGILPRSNVGTFPTEMVSHFFRSLSESLKATLHIKVTGENTHHMIESLFKAVGRCLRTAFERKDRNLPTTKGVL